MTADDDFSAYLHHIILYSTHTQITGNDVNAKAFGHGSAVEHDARVVAVDISLGGEADALPPYQTSEAVDGSTVGEGVVLEAEAPCVDEGSDGDVDRAARRLRNTLAEGEDVAEERVGLHAVAPVDAAEGALGVEHREAGVHLTELRFDVCPQVFVRLVGDVVERAEDSPLIVLERYGRTVTRDDNPGSYDEKDEHGQVPPSPLALRWLAVGRGEGRQVLWCFPVV